MNVPGQDNSEDTPLHTAARFGVPELAALYLAHGASVDALNSLRETPLMTAAFWAFDSREQSYSQEHHLVCRLLLDHHAGASPRRRLSGVGGTVCRTGETQRASRPKFQTGTKSRANIVS